MKKIADFVLDENQFSERAQKLLGLLFLISAVSISMLDFPGKSFIFFSKNFNIRPGVESTLLALLYLSPLYMRGIYLWKKNIYTTIQFVLLLTLFSSFFALLLPQSKTATIIGILVGVIAMAWFGVREIAKILWIVVAIVAIFQIAEKSQSMGVFGYLYILSAVLGLAFSGKISPAELVHSLKSEYLVGGVKSQEDLYVEKT